MFFVYVIQSISRNYIYVGLTNDLERRLRQHNQGHNPTTKPYAPFVLIHSDSFETRSQARVKEKYFKSTMGKRFIRENYLKIQ